MKKTLKILLLFIIVMSLFMLSYEFYYKIYKSNEKKILVSDQMAKNEIICIMNAYYKKSLKNSSNYIHPYFILSDVYKIPISDDYYLIHFSLEGGNIQEALSIEKLNSNGELEFVHEVDGFNGSGSEYGNIKIKKKEDNSVMLYFNRYYRGKLIGNYMCQIKMNKDTQKLEKMSPKQLSTITKSVE